MSSTITKMSVTAPTPMYTPHLLQSSDSLSVLSGEGAVTRHQRVPGHYHATLVPPGMSRTPQGPTALHLSAPEV